MSRGVVLYGPPASGKDTITIELTHIDPTNPLFRRLKAGPARRTGYRMTTAPHIDGLRSTGQVVWENSRFGATYIVDRDGLSRALSSCVPIVHLGQPGAPAAICAATPWTVWLVVSSWCSREVAAERLAARRAVDVPDRLAAWDATEKLRTSDLNVDTSQIAPTEAARIIHSWPQKRGPDALDQRW